MTEMTFISNWTQTQNRLVCKLTLDHLAKLAIIIECGFKNIQFNLHQFNISVLISSISLI